jgi:hypothetical protein
LLTFMVAPKHNYYCIASRGLGFLRVRPSQAQDEHLICDAMETLYLQTFIIGDEVFSL